MEEDGRRREGERGERERGREKADLERLPALLEPGPVLKKSCPTNHRRAAVLSLCDVVSENLGNLSKVAESLNLNRTCQAPSYRFTW